MEHKKLLRQLQKHREEQDKLFNYQQKDFAELAAAKAVANRPEPAGVDYRMKSHRKTPPTKYRVQHANSSNMSRKYYERLLAKRMKDYESEKKVRPSARFRRPVPRGRRDNKLISLAIYRRKNGSASYGSEYKRRKSLNTRELKSYWRNQERLQKLRRKLERDGLLAEEPKELSEGIASHASTRGYGTYGNLYLKHLERKSKHAKGLLSDRRSNETKYLKLDSKSLASFRRSIGSSRKRRHNSPSLGSFSPSSMKYLKDTKNRSPALKLRRLEKNIERKKKLISSMRKKMSRASEKTTYQHNKGRLSYYKHRLSDYKKSLKQRQKELKEFKKQQRAAAKRLFA